MPSRRSVLGAVSGSLASLVAGCVGEIGGDVDETVTPSEPAKPSKTAEPSETARSSQFRTGSPGGTTTPYYEGECETVEHEWVNPTRDSVEPKSLPEGPPRMDAGWVTQFVVDYEEAYYYNSVLEADTREVGVSVGGASAERVPGGFVVTLQSNYYYNVQSETSGNQTATIVHADGPRTMKGYLVTETRLVRAEGEYEQAPDPRKEGVTVECWAAE
jgi:hypothetical protein